MNTLRISEQTIRQACPDFVLAVIWRQWRAERRLAGRGVHFRSTALHQVLAAYSAMTGADFDEINARQAWANWRTIPRALNGQVPDRPLRVLDLGCGAGSSTQVLAHYCPLGSRITGYEIAEPLVAFAQRRHYRHQSGPPVRVDFVRQGIQTTLREADGQPVRPGVVDVINSSGVIGFHLNRTTLGGLVAEVRRVLRPDGVALLDVGPAVSKRMLCAAMAAAGFKALGHSRSWLGDPTGQVVFSSH